MESPDALRYLPDVALEAEVDILRRIVMMAANATADVCWEWPGSVGGGGYPVIQTSGAAIRIQKVMRRFFLDGTAEQQTLHHCDNPPCFNPLHLYAGSVADNMADRNGRGRHAHGSRSGAAKLTETDIPRIRGMLATGLTYHAVSRLFGVSGAVISAIARGKTWKHV